MNHEEVQRLLSTIGNAVCDYVYQSLQDNEHTELREVAEETKEDTIYKIDKDVEKIIIPLLEENAKALGGIKLIAEGLSSEKDKYVFPSHFNEEQVRVLIIMDPIDGTRGIMYNKRSAFFLAAAAPYFGDPLYLQDLEVAVMTEIPTSKAYLSDSLYAIRNQGAFGFRRNLFNNEISTLNFKPSNASSIIGGFAQISRFFPPGKDILARMEEELISKLSEIKEGKAIVFEDQYISSGGQLYELLMGHDRFTADLRPPLYENLSKNGTPSGLTCHPYDVCASLIGEEAGIIITDIEGKNLNVPLDLHTPVCWIAYANAYIQKQVEPVLKNILRKNNWTK
ncbi:hypothetical protein OKW21_002282 [Catalinimonas alkaloidigena]|uniref:inositol monophosphatase family protein n=1 Tax=Catalinimonas alkaloidigena TaxID=1075417 RepID=UPI002405FB3D|nr:inositol monophosphatase family protein [Catalinimonas alkaloidigena]MDF9797019.1 hypothetical protein [Catalinimonas alkaloidigena]